METEQEITKLLSEVHDGSPETMNRLVEAVYRQLHRIASMRLQNEDPNHTLQPTALVNEAYPGLLSGRTAQWKDRSHFFGAAAVAMRRILIDHARRKKRIKRGGGEKKRVDLDMEQLSGPVEAEQMVALDEALKKLEVIDPDRAEIVKLKFFVGLTNQEVADSLGMSCRTVERNWTFCKAWLRREME